MRRKGGAVPGQGGRGDRRRAVRNERRPAGRRAAPPRRNRLRTHLTAAEARHRRGLPASRRRRGRHRRRRQRLARPQEGRHRCVPSLSIEFH